MGLQQEAKSAARDALREDYAGAFWGADRIWTDGESLQDLILGDARGGMAFNLAILPEGERTDAERDRLGFRLGEAAQISSSSDYGEEEP